MSVSNKSDRFIPSREAMNMAQSVETYSLNAPKTKRKAELLSSLIPFYNPQTLLNNLPKRYQIINTNTTAPLSKAEYDFPVTPNRTFSAEDVSLIDWGKKSLVIVTGTTIEAYNYENDVKLLIKNHEQKITAVQGSPDGTKIAFSDENSNLYIIDIATKKILFSAEKIHTSPITCIDWRNDTQFTVSSKMKMSHYDFHSEIPLWVVNTEPSNSICALKWNADQNYLAISNENNEVIVYLNPSVKDPITGAITILGQYSHPAPVTILKWNPEYASQLVSGGGNDFYLFDVNATAIKRVKDTVSLNSFIWLDQNHFVAAWDKKEDTLEYGFCDSTTKKCTTLCLISIRGSSVKNLGVNPRLGLFFSLTNDGMLDFWTPRVPKLRKYFKSHYDSSTIR